MSDATKKDIAKILLSLFGTNPYHAKGSINADDRLIYTPVKRRLTLDDIQEHLDGTKTIGAYTINAQDSTVNYICWDVDALGNIDEARKLVLKILDALAGLPAVVEYSGRKGYHVFLFLSEPLASKDAYEFAQWVRKTNNLPAQGVPHVECYPKQPRLKETVDHDFRPGSLLKLPLGLHPVTRNRSKFIDPFKEWENSDEIDPLKVLKLRTAVEELNKLVSSKTNTISILAKTIATDWRDGNRHDLALSLVGFLAKNKWRKEDVTELVEKICTIAGDSEIEDRLLAVETTYQRLAQKQEVLGYSSLAKLLSPESIEIVERLYGHLSLSELTLRVERIRRAKGTIWDKRKRIGNLVWNTLGDGERGKFLYCPQNEKIYWFDKETKSIYDLDSDMWKAKLYQLAGIHSGEGFGRQVAEQLKYLTKTETEPVMVSKTSYLTADGILYINTGGPEVYKLDGHRIVQIDNGDDQIYFERHNALTYYKPNFGKSIDIWELLTDSVNFKISDKTSVKPDSQRELLKAWILSFFFRTKLPTRPILLFIGVPGSGKTTAARKITKILESPESEVMNIETGKRDSWMINVMKHSIFTIDNLEQVKLSWLPNALDRLATGSSFEVRKLYTDDSTVVVRSDCMVIITAVNVPFSKDTVFQRMLVLEVQGIKNFIPESVIQKEFIQHANSAWGDLLKKLNIVLREFNQHKGENFVSKHRLSDFAMFCNRIKGCLPKINMDWELLKDGISSMEITQANAMADSQFSIIPILEYIVETRPQDLAGTLSAAEVMEVVRKGAKEVGAPFRWQHPSAFSRHLRMVKPYLISEFGLEITQANIGVRTQLRYTFGIIPKLLEERNIRITDSRTYDASSKKTIINTTRIKI